MEVAAPSVAALVAKLLVGLVLFFPIIFASLFILRKKGWTAEINVIWYAFSLIFVLWWCLHLAMNLNIVRLSAPDEVSIAELKSFEAALRDLEAVKKPDGNPFDTVESRQRAQERAETRRRVSDVRRRLIEGEPWTARYFYSQAKHYLTDTRNELGLVAIILIVTIVPQLLNYILAGFSGCAATPRLVWQFEKIAIWSLIKFLAAFGGVSIADALGIYAIDMDVDRDWSFTQLGRYADDLLWGMGAVGLAFVAAVGQVFTLEIARALGDAWPKQPKSWPYRVHRYFTRYVPIREDMPAGEVRPVISDARQIWDTLTPAQQQEVGALVVRSLLDGRLAAASVSRSSAALDVPQPLQSLGGSASDL